MESGHGTVQSDDSQSVHVVDPVDRAGTRGLVEQTFTEGRAVVVIPHRPDHPGLEFLRDGLDERTQLHIRIGLASIGQVAGEDQASGRTCDARMSSMMRWMWASPSTVP